MMNELRSLAIEKMQIETMDRWTQATRACVWLVLNKTRDKNKKIYIGSGKV